MKVISYLYFYLIEPLKVRGNIILGEKRNKKEREREIHRERKGSKKRESMRDIGR